MHLNENLADQRDRQMDEAVVAYLRAEAEGKAPDRDAFLRRHAGIAVELKRFFADRDEVARLTVPHGHGTAALPGWGRNPALPLPSTFGAYDVLAEIGRGGMGVVYRARHRALNRLVALKMMAVDAGGGTDALARFRNEAQAAARLQHPNVVQIFEVGEHDGLPYLAMEYVDGQSLAQCLAGQPIHAAQAAHLVETLARAVHAAHQVGVIHRDLKPANILIHGSGAGREAKGHGTRESAARDGPAPLDAASVKITDFGLAKQLDSEVGMQTESGAILGTPCYMAPEQAEGRGRQAGPTTDIYSLGALLYELVTGRPPFRGVTRLDTLRQIIHDEPVPPRRLQSDVPRDLETICLKCLRKDPGHRYASAQDLAEDLHRYQAGEPIRARPVGRVEIAWRWCRRQPLRTALGLALILSVVMGLALVLWQWRRAEDHLGVSEDLRLQAESREAVTERLRQEAVARQAVTERLRLEAVTRERALDESERFAHLTLKEFMVHAAEKGLRDGQALDPQRRELLLKAQTYYQKFLQRRQNDPVLRQELAETSAHLANIIRQIGTPEEALAAYRRALTLFQELAKDDPDSVPQRYSQAVVHNHMASVLATLGRHGEALDSLQSARKLLEAALRTTPDDHRLETELVSTLHNIANVYSATRPAEETLAAFKEVRAAQEKLRRVVPDNARLLVLIAATRNSMGVLYNQLKQGSPEALEHFQEAVALRDRLARQNHGNLTMQNDLAESLCNLSDCLRHAGRLKDSLDLAVRALPILLALVDSNPHASRYRLQLAMCYANIGLVGLSGGDTVRGLANLEQGRKEVQKLAEEFPTVPDYQRRLADLLGLVAQAHSSLQQHEKALAAYQRQKEIELGLAEANPQEAKCASRLALTLHNVGVPLEAMGRAAEARTYVLQAVARQRLAVKKSPNNERFITLLSSHYAFLTHLERTLGHLEEAAAATEERLALGRADAAELYGIARDFALTAAAAEKTKHDKLQSRCADQACAALHKAVKAGFSDTQRLRSDAALDILRSREDFRKLLPDA
jgi:serine/threonine-protein kinase